MNRCNNRSNKNKKYMYAKNENPIQSLPDKTLKEAYRLAKKDHLNEDFISLLEIELKKRKILE